MIPVKENINKGNNIAKNCQKSTKDCLFNSVVVIQESDANLIERMIILERVKSNEWLWSEKGRIKDWPYDLFMWLEMLKLSSAQINQGIEICEEKAFKAWVMLHDLTQSHPSKTKEKANSIKGRPLSVLLSKSPETIKYLGNVCNNKQSSWWRQTKLHAIKGWRQKLEWWSGEV